MKGEESKSTIFLMVLSSDPFCGSHTLAALPCCSSLVFTVTPASNLHGPAASREEIWGCSLPCKDRERCCCLIRDPCSHGAGSEAEHGTAVPNVPSAQCQHLPRPPRQRKARASLAVRRVQMVSFCFSSTHTAEKQEGSLPAQQFPSVNVVVGCTEPLQLGAAP